MRYSIEDAIALIRRWKESESVISVVFSDVALAGSFTALIVDSNPGETLPADMRASFALKVLLPNGISGSSLIDVHLWGSEEIDFADFTDEPNELVPSSEMDRFSCCLAVKYEIGSLVKICEAWPDPRLEILRGPDPAFMEFLKRNKSK